MVAVSGKATIVASEQMSNPTGSTTNLWLLVGLPMVAASLIAIVVALLICAFRNRRKGGHKGNQTLGESASATASVGSEPFSDSASNSVTIPGRYAGVPLPDRPLEGKTPSMGLHTNTIKVPDNTSHISENSEYALIDFNKMTSQTNQLGEMSVEGTSSRMPDADYDTCMIENTEYQSRKDGDCRRHSARDEEGGLVADNPYELSMVENEIYDEQFQQETTDVDTEQDGYEAFGVGDVGRLLATTKDGKAKFGDTGRESSQKETDDAPGVESTSPICLDHPLEQPLSDLCTEESGRPSEKDRTGTVTLRCEDSAGNHGLYEGEGDSDNWQLDGNMIVTQNVAYISVLPVIEIRGGSGVV